MSTSRVAFDYVSDLIDGNGRIRPELLPAGAVVQEVQVLRTSNDATSSATFINTGLLASITPEFDDSVIEIEVTAPFCDVRLVSGNIADRRTVAIIRNETDSVDVGGECRNGHVLPATSDQAALVTFPLIMKARYAVDSTAERTFRLRQRVNDANLEVRIRGDDSPSTMILREIRQ